MNEAATFEDRFWESSDGLKLHCRDYPGDDRLTPIVCVPGLTRNARDFANLPALLNQRNESRRMIMADLRGRGESEYAKDSATYHPGTYVADIIKMMDKLDLPDAIFFGTSLGGIVTMLIAARHPECIKGALLNDIGPDVDQEGLDRIGSYVGQGRSFDTWAHAARDMAATSGDIFPDYELNDWIAFVKRVYRMNSSGRIKLDYDMKISEPFESKGGGSAPLWKALDAMKEIPTLILRGELSDLFSDITARKMIDRLEKAELVTVPRVGHAPTLEEPAALDAIVGLLQRTD
ncbi:alpha/beta hydrolase [Parasphingorhabdus sp.]|uniref:alpha/beta fold hydrolase n=1 Tax=Parasphingorhabdus sp. TaxID=2709688 RepID=UPI003265BE96